MVTEAVAMVLLGGHGEGFGGAHEGNGPHDSVTVRGSRSGGFCSGEQPVAPRPGGYGGAHPTASEHHDCSDQDQCDGKCTR